MMRSLSYEKKVVLFLSICITGSVILLVAFFFVQRSAISQNSFEVQTPDVDLTGLKNNLDVLQEQFLPQEDAQQEQEQPAQEQTQGTPPLQEQ